MVLYSYCQIARADTKGLAITFVSDENDTQVLKSIQDNVEFNITELPDEIELQ